MKKLVMVTIMIMAIVSCMFTNVYADAYDNYEKLYDYVATKFVDFYGDKDGVWYSTGYLDVEEYIAHGALDASIRDKDPLIWFKDLYIKAIELENGKQENFKVEFELYDVYDGVNIYSVHATADSDMNRWIDGIQNEEIMLVTIG